MVPAFSVFCLVIDDAVIHFHLSGGEIALEIGGIILGIPETEFRQAEEIEIFPDVTVVPDHETVYLAAVMQGHKSRQLCGDAVFAAPDDGISQTVAA